MGAKELLNLLNEFSEIPIMTPEEFIDWYDNQDPNSPTMSKVSQIFTDAFGADYQQDYPDLGTAYLNLSNEDKAKITDLIR